MTDDEKNMELLSVIEGNVYDYKFWIYFYRTGKAVDSEVTRLY